MFYLTVVGPRTAPECLNPKDRNNLRSTSRLEVPSVHTTGLGFRIHCRRHSSLSPYLPSGPTLVHRGRKPPEQDISRPRTPARVVYIHTHEDPPPTLPCKMYFESSPGSSPSKSIPISISPRKMASPTGSICSNYTVESNSRPGLSCAYPSWPSGSSLFRSGGSISSSNPSSFISDEDLFGFDDCHYLTEAPAPPRQPPMAQAFPVLPPLYAQKKPKSERRSSGKKSRRTSKPMSPISESPERQE